MAWRQKKANTRYNAKTRSAARAAHGATRHQPTLEDHGSIIRRWRSRNYRNMAAKRAISKRKAAEENNIRKQYRHRHLETLASKGGRQPNQSENVEMAIWRGAHEGRRKCGNGAISYHRKRNVMAAAARIARAAGVFSHHRITRVVMYRASSRAVLRAGGSRFSLLGCRYRWSLTTNGQASHSELCAWQTVSISLRARGARRSRIVHYIFIAYTLFLRAHGHMVGNRFASPRRIFAAAHRSLCAWRT